MVTEHQPRRLLVAGDVHGNRRWIGTLCKLARRHGCDAILQLGDFGYWPHVLDGQSFLKHVAFNAESAGLDCVYWIDGNHENHAALDMEGRAVRLARRRVLDRLARSDGGTLVGAGGSDKHR